MEGGCVSFLLKAGDSTVRKKRSKLSRWPRETTEAPSRRIKNDGRVFGESDEINGSGGSKFIDEKGTSGSDHKYYGHSIISKNMQRFKENFDLQSQNVGTHMNTGTNGEKRTLDSSDGSGNPNNVKKVRLTLGGVTRTIHTNSTTDGASASGAKASCSSDATQSRKKLSFQDTPDGSRSPFSMTGLQGVPWKDFSGGNFSLRKDDASKDKIPRDHVSGKKTDKSEPFRKSRRVPKRRVLDGEFDDEDDEIRYLKKLRNLKVPADCGAKYEEAEEGSTPRRKVPKSRRVDHEYVEDVGVSSSGRDQKKSRSERGSVDADCVEDAEITSSGVPDGMGKVQKESSDLSAEGSKELSLTRRQRALQSGKDDSANLVEFPNGLPPAPSKKNKEKLSEMEQQLKKAEAAQRRRMQVEKAAKESEAEAIRKILGQDSSRKKREDKLKKRRDELAQERAANAQTLPPKTVRWVIGPTGTVVTFSEDVGLPSIFSSKPCSYPPPREKCAGPSCTNPYVYRDSKSKLPLCSLKCYKAIHE